MYVVGQNVFQVEAKCGQSIYNDKKTDNFKQQMKSFYTEYMQNCKDFHYTPLLVKRIPKDPTKCCGPHYIENLITINNDRPGGISDWFYTALPNLLAELKPSELSRDFLFRNIMILSTNFLELTEGIINCQMYLLR